MMKAAEKAGRALVRDFGEVEHLQVSRKGPADFVSKADMRAAVAQPDQRIRMAEHLLHRAEIAIAVIAERPVEDRLAVILQQQIVNQFRRVGAAAPAHFRLAQRRRAGGRAVQVAVAAATCGEHQVGMPQVLEEPGQAQGVHAELERQLGGRQQATLLDRRRSPGVRHERARVLVTRTPLDV